MLLLSCSSDMFCMRTCIAIRRCRCPRVLRLALASQNCLLARSLTHSLTQWQKSVRAFNLNLKQYVGGNERQRQRQRQRRRRCGYFSKLFINGKPKTEPKGIHTRFACLKCRRRGYYICLCVYGRLCSKGAVRHQTDGNAHEPRAFRNIETVQQPHRASD